MGLLLTPTSPRRCTYNLVSRVFWVFFKMAVSQQKKTPAILKNTQTTLGTKLEYVTNFDQNLLIQLMLPQGKILSKTNQIHETHTNRAYSRVLPPLNHPQTLPCALPVLHEGNSSNMLVVHIRRNHLANLKPDEILNVTNTFF